MAFGVIALRLVGCLCDGVGAAPLGLTHVMLEAAKICKTLLTPGEKKTLYGWHGHGSLAEKHDKCSRCELHHVDVVLKSFSG